MSGWRQVEMTRLDWAGVLASEGVTSEGVIGMFFVRRCFSSDGGRCW